MTDNLSHKPSVAIFMVTYNHEKYIRQAVRSIVSQKTNFPYMLFIGEDCSTDNTRAICIELQQKYPEKISVNFMFNDQLSHKIYAASDFFFMPSRYEPCGLGQLISMSYGTLPIVRGTGGLEDTVHEIDIDVNTTGNGFKFYDQTKELFIEKTEKALTLYNNKEIMLKAVKNAMTGDYSWKVSAEKYLKLYEKVYRNI